MHARVVYDLPDCDRRRHIFALQATGLLMGEMDSDHRFRHSTYQDKPDMSLRYHVCDTVREELVATSETRAEAVSRALKYQYGRVHLEYMEVYDIESPGCIYRVLRSITDLGKLGNCVWCGEGIFRTFINRKDEAFCSKSHRDLRGRHSRRRNKKRSKVL